MKETVEWICFVIGGILILTAVLTHIFKINLGGASVEGQSNFGQKLVAFVAGWIFVLIGGVFHGVGMHLNYASASTTTSEQHFQPPASGSDKRASQEQISQPSPSLVSSETPKKLPINVNGVWRDPFGVGHHISQDGAELEMTVNNQYGATGSGTGTVKGRTVEFDMNIGPILRHCSMQLWDNGRGMSGKCNYENLGTVEDLTLEKIN